MHRTWFAIFLLLTGCAEYPVTRDGTAWNPSGINYGDPNAAPMYGSGGYGNFSSYPGYWWSAGSPFYPGYPGYSYLGYPCGTIWGCGRAVAVAPVVASASPAPVSVAPHVARLHNIARPVAGVSPRSGGRHRGRR
jgi:hypothetical protein